MQNSFARNLHPEREMVEYQTTYKSLLWIAIRIACVWVCVSETECAQLLVVGRFVFAFAVRKMSTFEINR